MDERDLGEENAEDAANDALANGEEGRTTDGSSAVPPQDDGDQRLDSEAFDPFDFRLSPEELPTLQWPDIKAELEEFEAQQRAVESPEGDNPKGGHGAEVGSAGPLDGLEDAMAWLEQLAAGQSVPIDEMPTLVTAPPEVPDKDSVPPEDDQQSPPSEKLPTDPGIDSDPMAWLEQLAVDQSSPLEELPSVAHRLLASEIVSQTEIAPDTSINDPIDVDQALTYLEQLAVSQGVDLSDVTFEKRQTAGSLPEALAVVDRIALAALAASASGVSPAESTAPKNKAVERQYAGAGEGARQEEAVDTEEDEPTQDTGLASSSAVGEEVDSLPQSSSTELTSEMPSDPQAALSWLSSLAEEPEQQTSPPAPPTPTDSDALDLTPVFDDPDFQPVQMGIRESESDAAALEEMPDDPDEAVAWMHDLASRKSPQDEVGIAESEPASAADPITSPVSSPNAAALSEAQQALDDGNPEKAVALYQSIVQREQADEALVAALEAYVDGRKADPHMLRLLGDAYMQTGQIENAVAAYRRGFDHL